MPDTTPIRAVQKIERTDVPHGALRMGPIVHTVAPQKPKLLDQVRDAIRTRHYSYRTEEAYVGWIKRFIFFHHKRHPAEMGPVEITQFLTALAVDRHVSASTQNQALAAILFLYNLCGAPHNLYYVQPMNMWSRPRRTAPVHQVRWADST